MNLFEPFMLLTG